MTDGRSSRRAVFRVAVSLALLLAGCASPEVDHHEDDRPFRDLALSALSVARPDYSFGPLPESVRTADGVVVTLSARPIGSESSETVPVTVTFGKESAVDVSLLPETRLGRVLRELGGSRGSAEDVRDTRELLSNMGRGVAVVAVAELVEPMPEAEVLGEGAGLSQPQGVLLSSGGDLPLGGSLHCGRACESGSWDRSYATDLQEWTSTLGSRDRSALQAFGLDLERLKAASRQGAIHGLVYEGYDARTMLEIAKDPRVKTLYVADVNLRCASEEDGICRPFDD